MFGRVPGTRPNISESHSEMSTRVPFCIARGGLVEQAQGGVGTWFYILYFLGISLVLVNMLIAIIMEAFDIVTKRAETEYIPNVGQQIATHMKRTYRQVVAA